MPLPEGVLLAEFKEHLDHEGTADDGELERILASTATLVQRMIRPREIFATGAGQDRLVTRLGRRLVQIPDAQEIVRVTVDGAFVPAHAYLLEANGPEYTNFTHLKLLTVTPEREIKLTGTFGYDPFPDDLKVDGIYTWAARRWNERKAGFADSMRLSPLGGETSPIVSYYKQLPPAAKLVIDLWRPTLRVA